MIEGLGSKVYLPPPLDDITLADVLRYVDLGDIEDEILPFTSGQLEAFDELKYKIAWTSGPRFRISAVRTSCSSSNQWGSISSDTRK